MRPSTRTVLAIAAAASLALLPASAGAQTDEELLTFEDAEAQIEAYASAFNISQGAVAGEMALDAALSQAAEFWAEVPGLADIEVDRDAATVRVALVAGSPTPEFPPVPGVSVEVTGGMEHDLESLYDLAFDTVAMLDAAGIDAGAGVLSPGEVTVEVDTVDRAAAELLLDGPFVLLDGPGGVSSELMSRGGARTLHQGGGKTYQCTSAFGAKYSSLRVLATAAHCLHKGYGAAYYAGTSQSSSTKGYGAREHFGKWGDFAILYFSTDKSEARFYRSKTGSISQSGIDSAWRGERVCQYGRTTNAASCSTVDATGWSRGGVGRLLRLESNNVKGGDSGGPVWSNGSSPSGVIHGAYTNWSGKYTTASAIQYFDEATGATISR